MRLPILCVLSLFCIITGIACAEVPANNNWTKVTASTDYGSRYDYGTVTFHDRLWVIGGHIQNGYLWGCSGNATCDMNDVWSSADGKTWELETDNAGFSPRSGSGVVVFHDRLWVIGGSETNDVWSSTDGKTWTCETKYAGFSPRSDMGVAVFRNQIWIIAGGTFGNLKNDVWSSVDGKTWAEITNSTEFSPRYGKGVAVFDNKLFIIGGVGDSEYTDPATDYTYINEGGSKDVWSSLEGKNWTLVTADAPFKYQEFTPVTTSGNRIWIVGGGNWETLMKHTKYVSPHAFSEIWSSPDGNNWTLEQENAGFSPRFLHGVTVFQNGIWVLGGTDNGGISDDVWYMPLQVPAQTPATTAPVSSNISSTVPVISGTSAKADLDSLTVCFYLFIAFGFYGYYLKWRI